MGCTYVQVSDAIRCRHESGITLAPICNCVPNGVSGCGAAYICQFLSHLYSFGQIMKVKDLNTIPNPYKNKYCVGVSLGV